MYQFKVSKSEVWENVKSFAHTGEVIAMIDKVKRNKFEISVAMHKYCKCYDGFVTPQA